MGTIIAMLAFGVMIILQSEPPTRERVVLLPNKDGTPSAVVIRTAKGETVLDTPYQQARIDDGGAVQASVEDGAELKARYAATLASLPLPAAAFTLHFQTGSDILVPDSVPLLERIKDELSRRAAPEIIVVGHTDRTASQEYNDALSLKRAEAMKRILVETGIPDERIVTAGRGEREPVVPTADGVDEPRNRRVEIRVR